MSTLQEVVEFYNDPLRTLDERINFAMPQILKVFGGPEEVKKHEKQIREYMIRVGGTVNVPLGGMRPLDPWGCGRSILESVDEIPAMTVYFQCPHGIWLKQKTTISEKGKWETVVPYIYDPSHIAIGARKPCWCNEALEGQGDDEKFKGLADTETESFICCANSEIMDYTRDEEFKESLNPMSVAAEWFEEGLKESVKTLTLTSYGWRHPYQLKKGDNASVYKVWFNRHTRRWDFNYKYRW